MGEENPNDNGNNPNFGTGNDGSVISKYHGSGSPDDFGSWDWKQIEAAITGIAAAHSDDSQGFQDALLVSDPQSLYEAANTLEYVKQTLQMVHTSISEQTDALTNGDNAPWKGPASQAFRQMMDTLSQNVKANAQVLTGDVGADDIPQQVNHNGLQLATAIKTIHDIDIWYANEAVKQGAPVVNGLVMVHEKPKIVEMMTHDMRQVITKLSAHYTVTNDGFTAPNTTDPNGPNNDTGGNNNPYGSDNSYGSDNTGGNNNPYGSDNTGGNNNPYGGGNPYGNSNLLDGNGSGGSNNANIPPPTAFPNDLAPGGDGGGGPSGNATDFTPPPVSSFPGGDGSGLGGPGGGSDLNSFGGPGSVDLAGGANKLAPPPVSPFPGSEDPNAGGPSAFVPPAITPFRTSDSGSSPDSLGAPGSVLSDSNPFNDTSGLDTSGLGGANVLAPPVESFPSGTGGGGADGLGGPSADGTLGSGLGRNALETSAPPAADGLPGLQEGGPINDGGPVNSGPVNSGPVSNQPMGGMPMMPPGMGMGGGPQPRGDEKSDTSGLLAPTPFPDDLSLGGPGPSGVLDSPGGATDRFGGLTGLDGFDDGLAAPPAVTDVVDPGVAGGPAEDNGLRQVPAGQPMSGMPMMPQGMGGMGGGHQPNHFEKSDASGLLTPESFPGGDRLDLPADGVLDTGGVLGRSPAGLDVPPAMPVLSSTSDRLDQSSDGSGLLTPEHEPWTDNTVAPSLSPQSNRIAVVRDGAEDFGAWDVTGSTSPGLPWALAHDHGSNVTDSAPPAEQQLATWRPERGIPGTQIPTGMPEVRSSFAAPDPAPEPAADPVQIDAVDPAERTFADLLDRRSDQWESRGSDLPGVLG
jgi:hypothetical protein